MLRMNQKLGIDEQISYLIGGIDLGVLGVTEVVQWADNQIATNEAPAYELIELSLMSESNRYEIKKQLTLIGAPTLSRAEVLPYLLAEAHKKLLKEPDFGKVLAEGLYRFWSLSNYDLPDNLSPCSYFADAYLLAESGVFGSIDQVHRELLEFSSQFQSCIELFSYE